MMMKMKDTPTRRDTPAVRRSILPMQLHKSAIIEAVRKFPADHAKFVYGSSSPEEAIAALEAHPDEFVSNGTILMEGT